MDFSKLSLNPFGNGYQGGFTGGVTGGLGPQQGTGGIAGGQKTGGVQSEINDVGLIGAQKRANFENGLGGTNNPDGHKLFLVA